MNRPTREMVELYFAVGDELTAHGYALRYNELSAELVALMDEMNPPLWESEMGQRVSRGTANITQAFFCEFGRVGRPAGMHAPNVPAYRPFPHHIARCRGCEECID